ncbi:PQQ-binding-like beta-propeller repeat protein [Streptomyces sp. NPDC048248]|uniref:outer membrane protein assembly factor BamB family protein n=1 Tax=Streptomyces sp. NPDC048248 TaxID=3365523 RepID=UPI00371A24F9
MTAERSSRYGTTASEPRSRTRWEVTRLNTPNALWGSNGVAFGPDGRLYAAQFLAGRISAVDPATGDVETVVPMDGPVQSPDDLAFAADGSMYITDLVPGRVWRRSPQGAYTLVCDQVKVPNGITCVGERLFVNEMRMNGRLLELFPDGSASPRVLTEGLALGNAMQLGPDGHLYYPHMVTGQVWRISPDGGEPELVAEDVHEPVAVRFDQGGVMLVLSRGQAGIVTRVDLHGTGSRSVLTSGLAGLDNAAFDAENRMFVSSFASGGITELHPDGRTRQIVPRGLGGPFGVTVDLAGTVYAADHYRVAGPESGAADDPDGITTHILRPFAHGISAEGGLLHLTSQYGEVTTYDPEHGTTRVRASGLRQPTGIAARPGGGLVVAETGAGRLLALDEDDTVTVLAEGLDHPVDVALDAEGRCYVSDDQLGAVLRIEDGNAFTVADGLDVPQGLAVLDEEVFTVETGSRTLRAVSLTTGEHRIDAEDLPVGLPPDAVHRTRPALFTHGMPGVPDMFAGLTAAPDGCLLLSANGEGTVLRLSPRAPSSRGPQHPVDDRAPRKDSP